MGLLAGRRQAIIGTNAEILLTGTLGINYSDIWIEIHMFSLKNTLRNVVWKMAAILSRPQCVKQLWFIVIEENFSVKSKSTQ